MDWQTVISISKPAFLDTTSSMFYVYERRNFESFSTDEGTFWRYQERKIPRTTFDAERIANLESENIQLQLALTELYEMFEEV